MGKAAMARQEILKACNYFQASLNSDFALGTLLNLAICHEQAGRIATAWAEYRTLEDKARRATPPQTDRAQFAHDHAEALRPRLSRVRIVLSPETAKLSGLVVKIDGAAAAPELFDVGVPVDLGKRKLTVAATRYEEWSTTISVDDEKLKLEAVVPPLKASAALPAASGGGSSDEQASAQRTVGYVVGTVGLAFVATGTVFGVLAIGAANDAECNGCFNNTKELRDAKSAYDRSNVFAWVTNVALAAGVIGVGVGAYLVLSAGDGKRASAASTTTPGRPGRRVRIGGAPTLGGAALTLAGQF